MNAVVEQGLIARIRTLSPQQVIEVDDFIEFLASKSKRSTALDRLLAIAPALEAVGAESINEDPAPCNNGNSHCLVQGFHPRRSASFKSFGRFPSYRIGDRSWYGLPSDMELQAH
jgi:hypothetical protein